MKQRVARIFERLPSAAEAIVVANAIDPHLDQSFFYLFDVPSGLFEGSIAVAFPDGRTTVLSSPLEEESARQAAKQDPSIEVVVPRGREESDAIVDRLLPRSGPIALNFRELTHEWFLRLAKARPNAPWVDASDAVRRARMV
ncbi:MAG TPA: aminopeptidase P family N-terminal domain-containing protein, partial [Thermoplasmata archaeon]|nr:aminopeptidase P family N-terminal domain-containing protein [Thermoplasmata archaeon]